MRGYKRNNNQSTAKVVRNSREIDTNIDNKTAIEKRLESIQLNIQEEVKTAVRAVKRVAIGKPPRRLI